MRHVNPGLWHVNKNAYFRLNSPGMSIKLRITTDTVNKPVYSTFVELLKPVSKNYSKRYFVEKSADIYRNIGVR